MTFVHDLNNDSAEFVVLDAQDFSRGYVAQVKYQRGYPSDSMATGSATKVWLLES